MTAATAAGADAGAGVGGAGTARTDDVWGEGTAVGWLVRLFHSKD